VLVGATWRFSLWLRGVGGLFLTGGGSTLGGFTMLFLVVRDVFFACFPPGLLPLLPGCHTCGIPSWGGSFSSLPISLQGGARFAGPRGPSLLLPVQILASFASRCRSASLLLSPHPGSPLGGVFLPFLSHTSRRGQVSAAISATSHVQRNEHVPGQHIPSIWGTYVLFSNQDLQVTL